jgi:hypothetical protein
MNEDNLYTIFSPTDFKKFQFNLSDFTGARIKFEKSLMPRFKKINIKGFMIFNDSVSYIDFHIDKQLFRKLKMMSLSDMIIKNSDEYFILQLIHSSKEIDKFENYYDMNWFNFVPYKNEISFDNIIAEEKRDNNRKLKYQSKQLNQRVKQYNKFRR